MHTDLTAVDEDPNLGVFLQLQFQTGVFDVHILTGTLTKSEVLFFVVVRASWFAGDGNSPVEFQ